MTPQEKWKLNNPEKVKQIAKEYYAKNKERILLRNRLREEQAPTTHGRNRHYKHKYGITLAQYNEMAQQQGHVCAICKEAETSNRNLAVDHDHSTGKVRGLLCVNCNSALGKLKESTTLLQSAINYLDGHK